MEGILQVKNMIPPERKKGVVYEVPCKDCEHVYIGETGRTLEKKILEHKFAVRRYNWNDDITVHAWSEGHRVHWEAASARDAVAYILTHNIEHWELFKSNNTYQP